MSALSLRVPIGSSVGVGLLVSLCCGGSLVFTSVGLGAFYGGLGLANYVPQVFAIGALSIVALNYVLFRRAASPFAATLGGDLGRMRRRMLLGASVGFVVTAVSFIATEWYSHNVAHPEMLKVPGYGDALLSGVPNFRFLFIGESFAALALLWALPFPRTVSPLSPLLRNVTITASAVVLALLFTGGLGPFVTLSAAHDTHGAKEEHAPANPAATHAPASSSPSH